MINLVVQVHDLRSNQRYYIYCTKYHLPIQHLVWISYLDLHLIMKMMLYLH